MPAPPGQPQASPSRLNIPAKIAYLLGARWLQEIWQTVFFIYLARVSTTTYGEFMMALGLGGILLMVAEFGLNLPLVNLAADARGKLGDVLSQVLTLKTLFFFLALAGAVVFTFWQGYSPPLRRLLWLIGAGVALEALASTFFVVLQVEGRQDVEAKIRAAGATCGFGFGLATLFLGAAPIIVGLFKIIDSSIRLAAGLWLFLGRRQFQWLRPTWGKLFLLTRLGLIFALMEITASIYNKANLFFLQQHGGPDYVAQYSAAWQVVDGFSCLVSGLILQNVLYPMFVRLWQKDQGAVVRLAQETASWLLLLALPLMFILWAESDRLIGLIYGPNYPQAVWLQQYLVITILIAFWHNLAVFLLLSLRRERLLLGYYILGLATNLLWCALVLPLSPLLGAALAMIITKGAVALLTVTTARRHLNFLSGPDLLHITAALGTGAILYAAGNLVLPRSAAELAAILPFLLLAGWWWQTRVRSRPSEMQS